MIFVPCEGGISHNEIENAAPDDLAARVLLEDGGPAQLPPEAGPQIVVLAHRVVQPAHVGRMPYGIWNS